MTLVSFDRNKLKRDLCYVVSIWNIGNPQIVSKKRQPLVGYVLRLKGLKGEGEGQGWSRSGG